MSSVQSNITLCSSRPLLGGYSYSGEKRRKYSAKERQKKEYGPGDMPPSMRV